MPWPSLQYTRGEVNKAGEILSAPHGSQAIKNLVWAIEVLSNWRSCHGYAINTFQATLRYYAKKIDADVLVTQRLKRTPSILNKLLEQPRMNLARMHDIGDLWGQLT